MKHIVGVESPRGDGSCNSMQSIPKTSLLSLIELLAATGGTPVLGCPENDFFFDSVATDSRSAVAGGMFIPLVGEFQDGHGYIPAALEKGVSVILVNRDFAASSLDQIREWHHLYSTVTFVAVDHTMYGLQAAAAAYVKKFPQLIRIGITGSSGKTTTKEILASLLSTRFDVVMNKGNLNSETGLPLSCFEIRSHHQVGVFELGMNRKGEMEEIAGVLSPSLGVITNIGTAHIGILGSKDGIAQEKKQIFSNFEKDSVAFIPVMDSYKDFLKEGLAGKIVEYGPEMVSSVAALGLDGTSFDYQGLTMNLPLPGRANFYDALAALAVAQELGLTPEEMKQGLAKVQPLFGRSQVLKGNVTSTGVLYTHASCRDKTVIKGHITGHAAFVLKTCGIVAIGVGNDLTTLEGNVTVLGLNDSLNGYGVGSVATVNSVATGRALCALRHFSVLKKNDDVAVLCSLNSCVKCCVSCVADLTYVGICYCSYCRHGKKGEDHQH